MGYHACLQRHPCMVVHDQALSIYRAGCHGNHRAYHPGNARLNNSTNSWTPQQHLQLPLPYFLMKPFLIVLPICARRNLPSWTQRHPPAVTRLRQQASVNLRAQLYRCRPLYAQRVQRNETAYACFYTHPYHAQYFLTKSPSISAPSFRFS